jgi:hypothetical protein
MESRAVAAAGTGQYAQRFVGCGGVRRFRGGGGPGFVVQQPATDFAAESNSRGNAGNITGNAGSTAGHAS